MNDAQVYEMQVQIWKPNTWGVIDFNVKPKPLDSLSSYLSKHI
jgi:hypothetical protein